MSSTSKAVEVRIKTQRRLAYVQEPSAATK
jgi:hypothetical protein